MAGATLPQLERLFERPDLPAWDLPGPLAAAYGGPLGFRAPRLIANFVTSVDGVVALPVQEESGGIISEHDAGDRFVMGMLRACASAIVVGAETFRRAGADSFDAASIWPAGAGLFAQARSALGLAPRPLLVLVTGSGAIDVENPAVAGALIVTTGIGEARLRGRVPPSARVAAIGAAEIDLAEAMTRLHAERPGMVLTEGGPSLVGKLAAQGLLDEIFLTSSPSLFGRFADDGRKSLTHGLDLRGVPLDLLSVRRHASYLFLRYGLPESPRALIEQHGAGGWVGPRPGA